MKGHHDDASGSESPSPLDTYLAGDRGTADFISKRKGCVFAAVPQRPIS